MNNELEQNNPLKMIDDSEVEDLKIKSEEELQKYALINNFELENYGYINDIEVKDDEVVFLATEIGLSIYNISDPEHPVLISKSFASINFDLIYLDNDTLFIAGYYSSDLLIIDISDLSNPIILSTIYYGTMRGYFVVEDNLYIGYFSKLNV
ncbi:MAG: hypothetical protein FK734_00730 [Asgard group archaeon]|nr:hypothetical protein [Asgard group archaeon]